ncbi:hypothetical protein G7061_04135 [Erysipelothrix sp. HDW6B]|uniref:hypothetical protein n=1 Tax=Erysipelothrix sp. HDW6B TaxID=2714929 RepID=UPI00140CF948|nr:hypothetical protein [Erysipelothrix sp. HDW6B]QIK85844.1 hypothetical protein G7061_04135 [Erysipelothrix sp. HDW6B]
MKQVTFEEAMESFTKLSLDGRKNADILLSFIEQHKPPTWEEIVLVWEKLGYDNVNLWEHFKMLFLVGYGKNPLFVSLKDGIESNDDVYVDITVDMLNAINLTIRYLEAQENVDEKN